jgi:hypothetical protein
VQAADDADVIRRVLYDDYTRGSRPWELLLLLRAAVAACIDVLPLLRSNTPAQQQWTLSLQITLLATSLTLVLTQRPLRRMAHSGLLAIGDAACLLLAKLLFDLQDQATASPPATPLAVLGTSLFACVGMMVCTSVVTARSPS